MVFIHSPTWIGSASAAHDLIQQHAEGPHVGLAGELPVADGLRGGPFVRNLPVQCDVEGLLNNREGPGCWISEWMDGWMDGWMNGWVVG